VCTYNTKSEDGAVQYVSSSLMHAYPYLVTVDTAGCVHIEHVQI